MNLIVNNYNDQNVDINSNENNEETNYDQNDTVNDQPNPQNNDRNKILPANQQNQLDPNIINSDKNPSSSPLAVKTIETLKIPLHYEEHRSASSQNSSTQVSPRLNGDFILPYEVEKSVVSAVKEETKSALDIKLKKNYLPKTDDIAIKCENEKKTEKEENSDYDADDIEDLNYFDHNDYHQIVFKRYDEIHKQNNIKYGGESYPSQCQVNIKDYIRRSLCESKIIDPIWGTMVKKGVLREVNDYQIPKDRSDRTLVFESRFESGNLAAAAKYSDSEQNLLLQNDINTKGHIQWFQFSVRNTRAKAKAKFNLMNCCKPDSLYNMGMKVCVFSQRNQELNNSGWLRTCSNIKYQENNMKKADSSETYYTLSFTYEFEQDDDEVQFSHCQPYTYSELNADIDRILEHEESKEFVFKRKLCKTLSGNNLWQLTVTSQCEEKAQKKKRGVVVTSRCHPGETNGSWMMRGFINFIVSGAEEAKLLRDCFVFKIVPMINPDGVINGNYRCSLAGKDLNRSWKDPNNLLHPEVYYLREMIRQFNKERKVEMIMDFHGHSRKKNSFMYGNLIPGNWSTREFPMQFSQICPQFDYKSCSFNLSKSKEATLRISLQKDLGIQNIYTLEASFCGMSKGPFSDYHQTMESLEKIGRDFGVALFLFQDVSNLCKINSDQLKRLGRHIKQQEYDKNDFEKHQLKNINKILSSQKHIEELKKSVQHSMKDSLLSDGGNTTSGSSAGSDAVPSDDNLDKGKMGLVVPNAKEIERIVREEENPSLKRSDSKLPKKQSLKQSKFKELNKSLEKENEKAKGKDVRDSKLNRKSMDKEKSNSELRKNFITERNKTIRNRQIKENEDNVKKEPITVTIETQCTLEYEIKIKKQISKLMSVENNKDQSQDIVELTKEMKKFDINNYKNKSDFDKFLVEFKKKEKNQLEQKAREKDKDKQTKMLLDEKLTNAMPSQAIGNLTSLSSLTNQPISASNSTKQKSNTNFETQNSFKGSINQTRTSTNLNSDENKQIYNNENLNNKRYDNKDNDASKFKFDKNFSNSSILNHKSVNLKEGKSPDFMSMKNKNFEINNLPKNSNDIISNSTHNSKINLNSKTNSIISNNSNIINNNQVNLSNFSVLDSNIIQRSRSKSKSNEKYKSSNIEEFERPKSQKQSRSDIRKINQLLNNSQRKNMNSNSRNFSQDLAVDSKHLQNNLSDYNKKMDIMNNAINFKK